jgi:Ca2+ transporting ATPase
VAISKDAGILPPDYVYNPDSLAVLEGKTFRQLVEGYTMTKDEKGEDIVRVGNENHFRDIARELRVLARSSPEDKFILVTGLKQIGNVVAVTGDGTNGTFS